MADEAIALVLEQGDLALQPDLLCTRAEIEVALGNAEAADAFLHEAMAVARSRAALSWQLRTGLHLARLRIEQGHPEAAREILQPIYDCFTEGFATMDLCAARVLLDELR